MFNKTYETNRCYSEFISKREAILANLSPEGLTLKFLWKNPDVLIREAFSSSPFFQLYFKNEIMFLLLKFNGLKWLDIPMFFTKNSKNLFYSDSDRFPCRILLANSNTGRLFISNVTFMPKGITRAFIQGVHTQKDLSEKTVIEKINSIRSSYSATEMSRMSLGRAR